MIHVVNSVYYETNFDLTKSGHDGIIPSLRIDDERACNSCINITQRKRIGY